MQDARAATTSSLRNVSATDPSDIDTAHDYERAAVTLDGQVLFQVRGLPAYPAAEREGNASKRIAAIAADRSVSADSLRVLEMADRSRIVAGDNLVAGFVDSDGAAEGVSRQFFTERRSVPIAMTAARVSCC